MHDTLHALSVCMCMSIIISMHYLVVKTWAQGHYDIKYACPRALRYVYIIMPECPCLNQYA